MESRGWVQDRSVGWFSTFYLFLLFATCPLIFKNQIEDTPKWHLNSFSNNNIVTLLISQYFLMFWLVLNLRFTVQINSSWHYYYYCKKCQCCKKCHCAKNYAFSCETPFHYLKTLLHKGIIDCISYGKACNPLISSLSFTSFLLRPPNSPPFFCPTRKPIESAVSVAQ